MTMKKKILTTLSVVLILGMAALGILAYLTSEDSDVNVMTLGNVDVELQEMQRTDDKTALEEYVDGKAMVPAVYKTGGDATFNMSLNENYIDKIVLAKNTGKSDAYMRVVVAIPTWAVTTDGTAASNNLHTNFPSDTTKEKFKTWMEANGYDVSDSDFLITSPDATVEIEGQEYFLLAFTYQAPVEPGETTIPSLLGVYLDDSVDYNSETGNYIGVDGKEFNVPNGKLVIPVKVQAVQAEGFDTADAALEAGFGSVVNAFEELKLVDTAEELEAAIANGGQISLANDVTVAKKITVPAGKSVNLDLNGCELAGAFDNNGGSALIENKGTLTISNGTVVSLAEYPDVDWGTEGFPTYATNTISNRGTLVIEKNATIENQTNVGGASYAVDNYAGATLIVNGGTVKAKDVAIRMFSNSATAEDKVVINDGLISGKRAVWVHLPSSNSAVAPLTTLEINGGDLKSTSDFTIYSYSYGNSFANTNIIITGGIFEKNVAFGGGYKGDKENVTVTGGTFNGALGRYLDNDGWEDIARP